MQKHTIDVVGVSEDLFEVGLVGGVAIIDGGRKVGVVDDVLSVVVGVVDEVVEVVVDGSGIEECCLDPDGR